MLTTPEIAKLLLRGAAALFVAGSLLLLLFVGLLPHTGLYRTMTVLSGSMTPTFAPGDLVIAQQKPAFDVQTGDIVVYSIPIGDHHIESHRIVQIVSRSPDLVVRTKGDANATADPWTAKLDGSSIWTIRGTVPFVGHILLWLRSPLLHKLTLFVTPAVVAFLVLRRIWRREQPAGRLLDN